MLAYQEVRMNWIVAVALVINSLPSLEERPLASAEDEEIGEFVFDDLPEDDFSSDEDEDEES